MVLRYRRYLMALLAVIYANLAREWASYYAGEIAREENITALIIAMLFEHEFLSS